MATLDIRDLPEPLYQALRELAEARHRTVEAEAIQLLTDAVHEQNPRSIMELRGLGKDEWRGIEASGHVAAERDSWE